MAVGGRGKRRVPVRTECPGRPRGIERPVPGRMHRGRPRRDVRVRTQTDVQDRVRRRASQVGVAGSDPASRARRLRRSAAMVGVAGERPRPMRRGRRGHECRPTHGGMPMLAGSDLVPFSGMAPHGLFEVSGQARMTIGLQRLAVRVGAGRLKPEARGEDQRTEFNSEPWVELMLAAEGRREEPGRIVLPVASPRPSSRQIGDAASPPQKEALPASEVRESRCIRASRQGRTSRLRQRDWTCATCPAQPVQNCGGSALSMPRSSAPTC